MFDSVRNSKRVVQVILVLIILPFALWGVESYVRNVGSSADVAKVGKSKISQIDFHQAVRDQQDRLRATLGREFNAAMFDTPEARAALLESLINQRLLSQYVFDSNVGVTDDQMRDYIVNVPAFQVGGKFSMERFQEVMRSRGLSESALRHDLALQQVSKAITDGAIVTRTEAERLLALQKEQREISPALVRPEQFAAQVKLTADAIKAYYEANRKVFEVPQQVRIEYVMFSPAAMIDQVNVPEEEIKDSARATLASGTAILALPLILGRLADLAGIWPAYGVVIFLLLGVFGITGWAEKQQRVVE